jgi:hypothetical protein
MSMLRRYVLPVAAGATLVLGLAVGVQTAAVAKAAKAPSIKVTPKTTTNGATVTVTGKNWNATLAETDPIGIDECEVGTTGENGCDTNVGSLVTTVNSNGTWSATLTLASPYEDANNSEGNYCGTTKTNESKCEVGAGSDDQTQAGAQSASETIKIKPPKTKK